MALDVSHRDNLRSEIVSMLACVDLSLSIIPADQLSRILDTDIQKEHAPFMLSKLEVKNNLGKRLLWVTGEIACSNGIKRTVQLNFGALEKGIYVDIQKIDISTLVLFEEMDNKCPELRIIEFIIDDIALK